MYTRNIFLYLILLIPTCILGQTSFSAADLQKWDFYGLGSTGTWGKQFYMKEDPKQSKGVMIISPKAYGEHVTLKYDLLTLTPSTVCVAILAASTDQETLNIPPAYDGAIGLWSNTVQNYFMAFRNAPHGFTPFLRKYPESKEGNPTLASAKKNVMHSGEYHSIEVGRNGAKLWLKIDGKKVLNATDATPLKGGHIALRIRGTAGEHAACLIKNLEIIE